MAIAYYFPEEEAGDPDTELTELRKLAFSIEDASAMTDQQCQAVEHVIDVISECLVYIKIQRQRLIAEPIVAQTAIRQTGRSGLLALYGARLTFGEKNSVPWPSTREHQKWSVGASIPGSAENAIIASIHEMPGGGP